MTLLKKQFPTCSTFPLPLLPTLCLFCSFQSVHSSLFIPVCSFHSVHSSLFIPFCSYSYLRPDELEDPDPGAGGIPPIPPRPPIIDASALISGIPPLPPPPSMDMAC